MITIIVAATRDMAIGRGGDLLYHISDDLKRFKSLTMGWPIIMGRKTFESFPKGALPGRRNIVVTRNAGYTAPGVETASSLDEALAMCEGTENVFIIGADRLELTLIDAVCDDADTRFPSVDLASLGAASPVFDRTDPRSGVRYCFLTLELC